MNTIEAGVSGRYQVSVIGPRGRRDYPWQDNLITDHGMNSFFTNAWANSTWVLAVGTGAGTPAFTDAALFSHRAQVGYSPTPSSVISGLTRTMTSTFTFAAGAASGNLTELGIRESTTGNLFTHALFLDGNGDPTTITVLSDEQLVVTYVMTLSVSGDVSTDTVTDPNSGVTYSIQSRVRALDVWNNYQLFSAGVPSNNYKGGATYVGATAIGDALSAITGGTEQAVSVGGSASSYVSGQFYRDFTFTYPINQANRTNINAILGHLDGDVRLKWFFTPAFTKTNLQVLSLTYRLTISRG